MMNNRTIIFHRPAAIIVFMAVAVFSGKAVGQTQQLSREDFLSKINGALNKTHSIANRRTQVTKTLTNDEVKDTLKLVHETLPPDRWRVLETETDGKKARRTEVISIKDVYYQRNEMGLWTKPKAPAMTYGRTYSGDATTEYTIEQTQIEGRSVVISCEIIKLRGTPPYSKQSQEGQFMQTKYYLSADGLVLREESEGGIWEPKRLTWSEVVTYDYKPKNLRIEAPIP